MKEKLLIQKFEVKAAEPEAKASEPYWQPAAARAKMHLILFANLSKLISPIRILIQKDFTTHQR